MKKPKEKNVIKKFKKTAGSMILYAAALIVALIAVVLLINNIELFRNTVSGYTSQGYASADVLKQLVPSQLVPGILQPIAVYGGISILLFGAGIINSKVSKCLILLNREEASSEAKGESTVVEEAVNGGDNKKIL